MSQKTASLGQLVQIGDAVSALAEQYQQSGTHPDKPSSVKAALQVILNRLIAGRAKAWANGFTIVENLISLNPNGEGVLWTKVTKEQSGHLAPLPAIFWTFFARAKAEERSLDHVTGDCTFETDSLEAEGSTIEGRAYELQFETKDLPMGAVNRSFQGTQKSLGGARVTHDWERAIMNIIFRWADDGSWVPTTQSEVERVLGDLLTSAGKSPASSEIRKRARMIFPEFQRRAQLGDNLPS